MKKFPDLSKYPRYRKIRLWQEPVNNQDFVPVIVDNMLSDQQLEYIKEQIKSFPKENIRVQTWGGQGILDGIIITEDIKKKIEDVVSDICKEEMIAAEFSLARYSPEYGYEVKLFPHYDTRPIEMFVFDIQLQTNQDWGVIVEGTQYNLKDNQALLFAGTQQLHWREKKQLNQDAEIYMLFCWMKHKKEIKTKDNHNEIMQERERILTKEANIGSEEVIISDNHKNYGHWAHQSSSSGLSPLSHNEIYKNIFTEEEIKEIYNCIDIEQTKNTKILSIYGQKVWFVDFPQSVKDRITDLMVHIHNQHVKLEEFSFARYSKEYGKFPLLNPHYDNTFKEHRLTLDIQLKSNIDWPIVVEDKIFYLKDNEALTFSGTNQIHWREYRDFKDGDFVEMIFCHFSLEDKMPISLEDKVKIEQKMALHSNQFAMSLVKENNRLKDQIRKYTYE